jgi:protein-S-isoprenylcysteine O-methyltransferase Ste14
VTPPLPFAWPYALVFWPVYFWVFYPEFRVIRRAKGSAPTSAESRGSFRAVVVGSGIAMFSPFVIAFLAPAARLPGPRLLWFSIGVLTLVAGSLLRRHCFRVLGSFFTGAVTIQAEHRVIDTGAYRFVRHPSYTAALLMVLGIALSFGNWLGVVISFALAAVVYSYRAGIEEKTLLAALGPSYAEFLASRKRFVPLIW